MSSVLMAKRELSADDKDLIDRVRALTNERTANRIAHESGMPLSSAKRLKTRGYPSRIEPATRERLRWYLEELEGGGPRKGRVARETRPHHGRAEPVTEEFARRLMQKRATPENPVIGRLKAINELELTFVEVGVRPPAWLDGLRHEVYDMIVTRTRAAARRGTDALRPPVPRPEDRAAAGG